MKTVPFSRAVRTESVRRGRPSKLVRVDLAIGDSLADNPNHPLSGLTTDQRTDARLRAVAAVLAAVARRTGLATGVRKAVRS